MLLTGLTPKMFYFVLIYAVCYFQRYCVCVRARARACVFVGLRVCSGDLAIPCVYLVKHWTSWIRLHVS